MPGLLTHISRYSLASILTTVAGLISFPILTRLLGPSQYGLMTLVSATLLLWVSLGKCGLQHAALRFYSEFKASGSAREIRRYYSTLLFGMAGLGLATTAIWIAVGRLLPRDFWADPEVTAIFLLSAPLIGFRILDSAGINVLRAREQSGLLSVYSVACRYASLALVVLALLFVAPNLYALYSANLIAELVAVAVLVALVFRGTSARPRYFSRRIFIKFLAYGVPMIGFELTGTFMVIGDRYVIQYFLGTEPLGVYSAAYNLCMYVEAALIAATAAAVQPAYLRLWESEGREATQKFINESLAMYALVAVPAAVGLSVIAARLITLLASEAYLPGAVIVPYVISAQMIGGLWVFVAAGLYIRKRSWVLLLLVTLGAGANLALNLVLVPIVGLIGAAQATLFSYLLLVALVFWVSFRELPVRLPWRRLLVSGLSATAMGLAIGRIRLPSIGLELAAQVAAGVLIYFGLACAFDRDLRARALELAQRGMAHAR